MEKHNAGQGAEVSGVLRTFTWGIGETFPEWAVRYPSPRRRAVQVEREANTKVLRREPAWNVLETVRDLCDWSRGSEKSQRS